MGIPTDELGLSGWIWNPDVKIPIKNITHFERIIRFKRNMHDFIIEKVPKAMLNERD